MEKIRKLSARQQEIVDAARSAGRDLTAEENREFEDLQRQINELRAAEPNTPEDGNVIGARGVVGPTGPNGSDNGQRAVAEERQRISDIMALCRETGMEPEQYIRNGASLDTVRQAAIPHLIQHGAPVSSRMNDQRDNFRAAAVDAVLMRAGIDVQNPTEGVEQYRDMSLRDIAIECLSRDGQGTPASLLRMGKDDLWSLTCRQFFNPTAAFPAILDNAIKKSIENQYTHVPTTFQLWTSKGSLTDFKASKDHSYLVGGAGEFLRVGESGEIKHDTPKTERVPQRKLDTYGRQFSMTRQAFINDDIGFITEVPGMYAASAKRTINKQAYKILVDNPTIFDGVPLFDKSHNNLVDTGSAPSNKAIQNIMMKLLMQIDPFGESIMVEPAHIIVPVGYKFLMTTILSSPTLNTSDNTQAVNPLYQYREKLQIVEEGALNTLAGVGKPVPWFMIGDKTYAKSLQVDYLNGQETPTIRRSEVAGQLGFVWDIFLDWGITVVDYRGIAKNPGVEINL